MGTSLLLALGSLLLVTLVSADVVKFHGHSVLRVIPQSEDQLWIVSELLEDSTLDIWKEASRVGMPVDFRVSPTERQTWMDTLSEHGLDTTVMIQDVQALLDQTTPPANRKKTRELDTSRYYNLAEIWEFMDEKVEQCGDLCEVISIGTSYEGRDLKVMKVGSPNEDSPSLWLDHGIHAREWISPAVGMYHIERLVADYGTDDVVNTLREGFNFYIELNVNPDGYDYTWTTDRMWRQTRSDFGNACIGTDGNRNFDWGWGGRGASNISCAETYHGPSAFSEVEIQAINDFVSPFREEFRLVYTYHSYGMVIYYPWGDGNIEPIPDRDDYRALCNTTVTAMNEVHGETYRFMWGGAYAGNTPDWGYGSMEIKYAMLLELRDNGQYGFLLPPDQILPQDEETWAGLTAMTLQILEEEEDRY